MIKLIETDISEASLGFSDIITLKQGALFRLYGEDLGIFASWKQITDKRLTAVIFSFAGAASVSCTENADAEELKEFLRRIVGTRVYCSKKTAEILGGRVICENTVMKFGGFEEKPKKYKNDVDTVSGAIDYKLIYDILKSGSDGEIHLPRFEDWYVDFCHRVRHGGADAVLNDSGTAAAVISLKDKHFALVGGVCTRPEMRNHGEAKRCLSELLRKTGCEKPIFAIVGKGTEGFYEKCGFHPSSKYCLTEIDDTEGRNERVF